MQESGLEARTDAAGSFGRTPLSGSSGRRVLVTGGSGFIGTNLVGRLVELGVPVCNLDKDAPRNQAHRDYWQKADLLDSTAVARVFEQFEPTDVVHLAARTDLEGKDLVAYAANTDGVGHLIGAVRSTDSVRRVVFGSSMLVCRAGYLPRSDQDYAPSTLYGESKVQGEVLVRGADFGDVAWTIVRPTSIWGPWFGEPYRRFFEMVLKRQFVSFGATKSRKTFGYVGNVVQQLMALLENPTDAIQGRVFYLGDQPAMNPERWASLIARVAGVRQPRRVPFGLVRTAAWVGDGLNAVGIRVPMTSFRLRNMTTDNEIDVSPIHKLMGNPPFDLEQGVSETVEWLHTRR